LSCQGLDIDRAYFLNAKTYPIFVIEKYQYLLKINVCMCELNHNYTGFVGCLKL